MAKVVSKLTAGLAALVTGAALGLAPAADARPGLEHQAEQPGSQVTSPDGVTTATYSDGSVASVSSDGDVHYEFPSANPDSSQRGACEGNIIDPTIVSRGNGTAVHYGLKFNRTEPVPYTLDVRSMDKYEDVPGGPLIGRLGGDPVQRSGVDFAPFVEAWSFPCLNNLNSGWIITGYPSIRGQQLPAKQSPMITVGCRV